MIPAEYLAASYLPGAAPSPGPEKVSGRFLRHQEILPDTFALPDAFSRLPPAVKHWTLTTMREKLIKIGAKVVRHSKYVFFQMAEVALPRDLFAAILDRIQRLRAVPGMAPS